MGERQTVSIGPWQVETPDGELARREPDAGPDGREALRLEVSAEATLSARQREPLPAAPGRAYRLALPVRTALNGAFGQMQLTWLDAAGVPLETLKPGVSFLEHDFVPIEAWVVAPPGAAAAAVGLDLIAPRPEIHKPAGHLVLREADWSPSVLLQAKPTASAGLFDAGVAVRYLLTVTGAAPESTAATLRYQLTDYRGDAVTEGERPVPLRAGAGRAELALDALPVGYYELSCTAEAEGLAACRARYSFGVLAPPDVPVPADSPIAVDAGLCWGSSEPARAAGAANACAKIGLRMLRERMSWRAVNPGPGQFDWGLYARTAAIERAAGLDVYQILHDCPAWAQVPSRDKPPVHSHPPADPRVVYRFTNRLVRDLGDAVRFLEMWNEPEIFFFTGHPWDLAAMIKAGYLGARDADPSFGILNASRCAGPGFWRLLLANGVGPYFDIWNRHSYDAPEKLFDLAAEDRALMAEAGLSRPIWITEMGLRATPQPDGTYTLAERVQVAYLLRAYACALAAGIERFMYFYLQEFLEYGVNLWGLLRSDQSPKPAWIALATLIRQAGQARPVGYLNDGERYCVVLERREGDHVGIAWSLEGSPIRYGWGADLPPFEPGESWSRAEGSFDLPVKDDARLIDPVGRVIRTLTGPTAEVPLSVEPVFVRGLDVARMSLTPAAERPRYRPSTEPAPDERRVWLQVLTRPGRPRRKAEVTAEKLVLHARPGEPEALEFRIHNWSGAPVAGELHIHPPAGWTAKGPTTHRARVDAGSTEVFACELTPGDAKAKAEAEEATSLSAALVVAGRARDVARVDYTTANKRASGRG